MTAELNVATVAASPWEQATLSINGKKVEWGAELVLLRGQENDVAVEAPPAIARAINLGLAEGGGLSIVASPNFGDWVAPVDGPFNWKITPGAGKSGRVTLVFFSREVEVPWEHRSLVISSNLADEADVKISGAAVPGWGNWFIRDKARTVTLIPKSGSPLAGLPVTLTCVIKSGLGASNVVSAPAFGSEQTTYSWVVTGNTKSGTFQLTLSGRGMEMPIIVAVSRLVSNNLADEAVVKIGGKEVLTDGYEFVTSKMESVEIIRKPGSPFFDHAIWIVCSVNSPLTPHNVMITPPPEFGQTVPRWDFVGHEAGTLSLTFVADGMSTPISLPQCKIVDTTA